MSRRFHCLGILTLALLLGAAEPATKPAVDLATPKAAVKAFAAALRGGDAAMAKAVSLNNKQTLPYVEALVEAEGNRQRLADAAAARWGEVGRPLAAGDFAATLLELADLPFQIEGETARLPHRDEPVLLRKTAGLWKMDWASVAQHLDVAEGARWLRADAMATARTTAEVKAGTYKTAQEALPR